METDVLLSDVELLAEGMGAAAFGVADLEWLQEQEPSLLERVPGSYVRAVVMGVRLQNAALADIDDRPTPIYFHNYRQANYQLDRIGFAVADEIQAAGHNALAVPASQIICKDPMSGHISHKLLGWAAGLGHIGRNSLLVHKDYGCRMRYVSVLTDARLVAGGPVEGACGECRACVEVCPADAIGETYKNFDLDACYKKLSEFTRIAFVGQHICGVCVKACKGCK